MSNRERREINTQKRGTPSVHHIINRCQYDLYNNLEINLNKHKWTQYAHERHHISQDNNSPHETLAYYSFFLQVMSEKAKKHLQALLDMSPDEFYNPLFLKT